MQIKKTLTNNIDYNSIPNECKFTQSNRLNLLNNDYKYKQSVKLNMLNDKNINSSYIKQVLNGSIISNYEIKIDKSIMKEVLDKFIVDNRLYQHQRVYSVLQDRKLTSNTGSKLTPINEVIFSAFTPSTYLELKEEISLVPCGALPCCGTSPRGLVEKQITDLKSLKLDDPLKDAHADRLQPALTYYYGQCYNHEKAVFPTAKDIPLNDEDMDKVYIDLHLLKTKISNLIKDLDKNSHRRLNP